MKKMLIRHTAINRFCHWVNAIAIFLLILTGFYINSPQQFHIFSNMDTPRMLHFAMAYLLIFGFILRIVFGFFYKEGKDLIFRPIRDTLWMPSLAKYYLFLSDEHPDYGKYNPGQRAMYTTMILLVVIQIITGFILMFPNSWVGLAGFFGGYIVVRIVHLVVTWIFLLFIMVHVYLDLADGITGLKSIFTGKIPSDHPHAKHAVDPNALPHSAGPEHS